MKKSLLGVTLLTAFAGTAFAQNAVTIYGAVDAGVSHNRGSNAAGTVNGIDGGLHSPSRIGFKGVEDLGNGLSAIFTLENGFKTDDGTIESTPSGRLFGRQAFVGLQGGFGALKLGRQYTPLYNATSVIDPFGVGLAGDYTRLISVGAGPSGRRVDNAVTYLTPNNPHGFRLEGLYGFGEQADNHSRLREIGFNAAYASGPYYLVGAYHNAKDATGLIAGRSTAFGGTYALDGGVKLSGLYQINKSGSSIDTRDWLVGVTTKFGANTFMASYIRHINKAVTDADSSQFALGYAYALSNRTNLYTSISHLTNDGKASLRTGVAGESDNQVNAGIRHQF
ncbi:MAG: porin [Paucimonas sp.]|jgi:predicted porin|nr:porin [Paucimonas sp.]